jgi:hypothetical protein
VSHSVTHEARHRRSPSRRLTALVGLAAALAAAGWLLAVPAPQTRTPAAASTGPAKLTDVWPGAKVVQQPGQLPDGRAYTPALYLDATTSVGTALNSDGRNVRLLVRSGDGSVRQVQELPYGQDPPQFNGLTASGDILVWMVSVLDSAGRAHSTVYRADWRQGTAATALTADTGDPVFFNSQYDLVVADGSVHWAAAPAAGTSPVTELRSVPLQGGAVKVRRIDGAFAWSAWPWLVAVGSGAAGPVELVNTATGQRRSVPASNTELVICSPVWCRVIVLSPAGGAARTDLMTPDGKTRLRMAGGAITATIPDVALLDRFEVLSFADSNPAVNGVKLLLFDAKTNRIVSVAGGVATVAARGPVLWWSTGDAEAVTWYSLDLRTLR